MKKFFTLLIAAFANLINSIFDGFVNVSYFLGTFVELALPYAMLFLGEFLREERGKLAIGGEVFLPMVFLVIVYILHSIGNKANKGSAVPVPRKRFTEVKDDGEVTAEYARMEEMLLYMADLEDYLERKHLM